jgi:hypothetical protein
MPDFALPGPMTASDESVNLADHLQLIRRGD